MLLFISLLISEFLTFLVLRQHYKGVSRTQFIIANIVNIILSAFMWFIYIEVSVYTGNFDNPSHIWLRMSLNGAFCAIFVPRIILILLHFAGKLIRIRSGSHIRILTNTGLVLWAIILLTVASGTLTRFRYKTETVIIHTDSRLKDIDGLTIVHVSDMHLSSFYRHTETLKSIVEEINSHNPDILINSGDFVSYGWKEMTGYDSLLANGRGKIGAFAVLGNHDIGTYHPGFEPADIDTNIAMITRLTERSGMIMLRDSSVLIKKGKIRIAIGGTVTRGRHPDIIHSDITRILTAMDSADYRILISHDPNHWRERIKGKTEIDLTLAGHTHGMQMGIMSDKLKWSPSKYFYPEWAGLYSEGRQYLYVNRGLGVLAIPFRIWMPAEITVIKLSADRDS